MNKSVLKSLVWKISERLSIQFIQLIVSIVLARLLIPSDFGVIVVASIVVTISIIISQSGLNMALIQRKEVTDRQLSSVFIVNILIGLIIYFIIYIVSPYMEGFFEYSFLTEIIRVLSLNIFLSIFSSIQLVIISRNMLFKKNFIASLIAVIMSSFTAILLAKIGWGVWALVFQQIVYQTVFMLVLVISIRWIPTLVFSYGDIRALYSYSWKILLSNIIDNLYLNFKNILIGKFFNSATLGFYSRAEQLPNLLISSVSTTIQSVMFPVFSKYQDDIKSLKNLMKKTILISSYIISPLMFGLIVIAEPVVNLVFTEKWSAMIPLIQILCIYFVLIPLQTTNIQIINSLGRADILLRIETIKKTLGILIIIVSLNWGIMGVAWGTVLFGIISTLINIRPVSKLLNYSYYEQLKDIAPNFMLSILTAIGIYFVQLKIDLELLKIIISVLIYLLIYIILSVLLNFKAFIELKNVVIKKKL